MPYPDNFNTEAFDRTWGDDEPVDARNEDEVIDSRQEAKEFLAKISTNASPDSLLGMMAEMKRNLDAFNATRPALTNPATTGGLYGS